MTLANSPGMHTNRHVEAHAGTLHLIALGAAMALLASACATDSGGSGAAPLDEDPDAQVGTGGASQGAPDANVSAGGATGYECLGRGGYSCTAGVVSQRFVGPVGSSLGSGPCSRPVHECQTGCRPGSESAVAVADPAMLCAEHDADAGSRDAGNTDAADAPPCTDTCDGYCFTWTGSHGPSNPNGQGQCWSLPEACNGTGACACVCEGLEHGSCGNGTTACSCAVVNGVVDVICAGA